jgi:hypothetical protein
VDFVGFFICITEREISFFLDVLLFMKGHYLFRRFPGLARSFSESSFDDEEENTVWVK